MKTIAAIPAVLLAVLLFATPAHAATTFVSWQGAGVQDTTVAGCLQTKVMVVSMTTTANRTTTPQTQMAVLVQNVCEPNSVEQPLLVASYAATDDTSAPAFGPGLGGGLSRAAVHASASSNSPTGPVQLTVDATWVGEGWPTMTHEAGPIGSSTKEFQVEWVRKARVTYTLKANGIVLTRTVAGVLAGGKRLTVVR